VAPCQAIIICVSLAVIIPPSPEMIILSISTFLLFFLLLFVWNKRLTHFRDFSIVAENDPKEVWSVFVVNDERRTSWTVLLIMLRSIAVIAIKSMNRLHLHCAATLPWHHQLSSSSSSRGKW